MHVCVLAIVLTTLLLAAEVGPTPFSALLFSVSALSTSNVWAVGIFNSSSLA